jgi:hypothetical protein
VKGPAARAANFGALRRPTRRLVFSINDFDETLPGPFEWDVKRLVASFEVTGRDRGFDARRRRSINREVVRAYREAIREHAGMGNLDLWYSRIDVDEIAVLAAERTSRDERQQFQRNVAKARSKDSMKAFAKLTTIVDGEPRIASDPPLIVPIEQVVSGIEQAQLEAFVHGAIQAYRRTPERRPPAVARALPLRARGAQGRRRRQRRHARLDRAPARP